MWFCQPGVRKYQRILECLQLFLIAQHRHLYLWLGALFRSNSLPKMIQKENPVYHVSSPNHPHFTKQIHFTLRPKPWKLEEELLLLHPICQARFPLRPGVRNSVRVIHRSPFWHETALFFPRQTQHDSNIGCCGFLRRL